MTTATRPAPPLSLTIRIGARRLTWTWRARQAVPSLLRGLLKRSWRTLFGAAGAGAAGGLMLAGSALAADALPVLPVLPVNALPSGHTVKVGTGLGTADVTQVGNQLNVLQTGDKVILNWKSFNIGKDATVDFTQPNANAVALNRVEQNAGMSQLMGQLKSNGKVWLINPAGIMIGPDAKIINVAGFMASTLNLRDEDFVANRLTFSADADAGKVINQGTITTTEGGSVYLIGTQVENHKEITAPGGEVLLAAGRSVRLADTGTPGVTVQLGDAGGTVDNLTLGKIVSTAGRIGLAAGLVKNSGSIDASSVVAEGGRIFLRAGKDLTTAAGSHIAADGVAGGAVVLYASNSAQLDGELSAQGRAGAGGFVETSGKRAMSLAHAPKIGAGGHWLIDPDNVTIQATSGPISTSGGDVIVSSETVEAALNSGTSITLATSPAVGSGNITVASTITKSAGADATLTLSAHNDINIQQAITSTSGKLGLTLNPDLNQTGSGQVNISAKLDLNDGAMNVNGPMTLAGATLDHLSLNTTHRVEFGPTSADGGGFNTINSDLTLTEAVLSGGTLTGSGALHATSLVWSGGTIAGQGQAYEIGSLLLSGTVALDGSTLQLSGPSDMNGGTLTFRHSAHLKNTGVFTMRNDAQLGTYNDDAGASVIDNSGTINSINTSSGNLIGSATSAANGVAFNNSGTVNVVDSTLLLAGNGNHSGTFNIAAGTGATARLVFGAGDYNAGSMQTLGAGSKIVEVGNATLEFGNHNNFNVVNLTVDLNLANVAQSGATLQGSGALSAENFAWSGGTIAGGANSPAYAIKNLILTGDTTLDSRTLALPENGDSVAKGAHLTLKNTATLSNAGTLTLLDGAQLGTPGQGAGASTIQNSGTILSSGTGNSIGSANGTAFNNGGTLKVSQGSLKLAGNNSNTGSIDIAAGAVLSTADANLNNQTGGVLSGSGTIDVGSGWLVNNGTIAPGSTDTAGTLTLKGNLEQGTGGTLALKLGGAGAGQFDQLAVSGQMHLDGTLSASLINDYAPADGAQLRFLTGSGTRSGEFRTLNTPPDLQIGYNLFDGEAARLTYVAALPGDTLSYFDRGAGTLDWENPLNWSGNKLPDFTSRVVINGNFDVLHSKNDDLIQQLTIDKNNSVLVSGGSLSISGNTALNGTLSTSGTGAVNLNGALTGSGMLALDGGHASLNGNATIAHLHLADGQLDGSGMLNVTDSFTRSGGTINGLHGLSINQAAGKLAPGALSIDGPVTLTAPGGAIELASMDATRILATAGAGDIVLADGAILTATDSGNAIVLDAQAQHFVNQTGALSTPNGRFLIYTAGPDGDSLGTLDSKPVFGKTFASYAPASVMRTGNRVIYADAGTPYVIQIESQTRLYGDANSAFGYTMPNARAGDSVSGGAVLFSSADQSSAVGDYSIGASSHTFNSEYNLGFQFVSGNVKITPREVSVTASASKVYDGSTFFNSPDLFVSNLVNGDLIGASAASASTLDKRVGSGKELTVNGLSLTGPGTNNYRLVSTSVRGKADITQRTLQLTGLTASDKVYDGDVSASLSGGVLQGVIEGDAAAIGQLSATFADKNAGAGKEVTVNGVTLRGADAGNYRLDAVPAKLTATITQRPSSTWVGAAGGKWSERDNWEGRAVPDAANVQQVKLGGNSGDTVIYDAAAGNTTLKSLDSKMNLAIQGGHMTLGASDADTSVLNALALQDGALTNNGKLNIANYAQSGGLLNGGGNVTVSNSFSQSGGQIALSGAAIAAITQSVGNLVIGSLSAPKIVLTAPNGAISQNAAIVTAALTARSGKGITLSNTGNRIASFEASNSDSGDIVLTNTSSPGSLTLQDIGNDAGSITIDNTGAIVSDGTVKAARGSVGMTAHSPITVNGAIEAAGNIALDAQASSGGNDTIVLNNSITTSGGSIDLSAGSNVTLGSNSHLTVPTGSAIKLKATKGSVTKATGASISGATPTVSEGTPVTTAAVVTDASVVTQIQSPSATKPQSAAVQQMAPAPTTANVKTLAATSQTVGGTVDTFGGVSSTDSGGSGGAASSSTGSTGSTSSASNTSSASTSTASAEEEEKQKVDKKEDTSAAAPKTAAKTNTKALPVCN